MFTRYPFLKDAKNKQTNKQMNRRKDGDILTFLSTSRVIITKILPVIVIVIAMTAMTAIMAILDRHLKSELCVHKRSCPPTVGCLWLSLRQETKLSI